MLSHDPCFGVSTYWKRFGRVARKACVFFEMCADGGMSAAGEFQFNATVASSPGNGDQSIVVSIAARLRRLEH